MIAIFTHQQATEADRVIRHLRQEGADVVRVNTGEAEAAVYITVGASARIRCDGRVIDPGVIKAAWLHQLPPRRWCGNERRSAVAVAAQSSRLRLWEAVMAQIGGVWLTPPSNLNLAGNKALQYLAAVQAGLAVPPTVVGNDRQSVLDILGTRNVVKYLGDSSELWGATEDGLAAVAVEVDLEQVAESDALGSPAIFQRRIASARELRVVAIRDGELRTFAAQARKPEGLLDIRLADHSLQAYVPCEVPRSIADALGRMLDTLGVGFCSADILVDAEGHHFFLDLNAAGAWWWIDDLYDRQVTVAIAKTLRRLTGHD